MRFLLLFVVLSIATIVGIFIYKTIMGNGDSSSKMKNPLKRNKVPNPITDTYIMDLLGENVYVHNGISLFKPIVTNLSLYDNNRLKLSFGYIVSGLGDWGGFDRVSTYALQLHIDKDLTIHKVETDSFYNSSSSDKEVAEKAKEIAEHISVGDKVVLENEFLRDSIKRLFEVLPIKKYIGWKVFKHDHMIKHYTNPKEKDYNQFDMFNPANIDYISEYEYELEDSYMTKGMDDKKVVARYHSEPVKDGKQRITISVENSKHRFYKVFIEDFEKEVNSFECITYKSAMLFSHLKHNLESSNEYKTLKLKKNFTEEKRGLGLKHEKLS